MSYEITISRLHRGTPEDPDSVELIARIVPPIDLNPGVVRGYIEWGNPSGDEPLEGEPKLRDPALLGHSATETIVRISIGADETGMERRAFGDRLEELVGYFGLVTLRNSTTD